MEATPVEAEKIEKHWPKFGYAFSATALTLIVRFADKKEVFAEHKFLAMGLGATVVLGVTFARAIEYDGWKSFSLMQQGLIMASLMVGVVSIGHALLLFSNEVSIGVVAGALVFMAFALGGKRPAPAKAPRRKEASLPRQEP